MSKQPHSNAIIEQNQISQLPWPIGAIPISMPAAMFLTVVSTLLLDKSCVVTKWHPISIDKAKTVVSKQYL